MSGSAPAPAPGRAELDRVDDELRRLMRSYVESFSTTPVRSVAVVGNAPEPANPGRAARIDACDVVVRVNSFWVDGPHDPPSHGSRTTVVVVNRLLHSTPALFAGYRRRAYFVTEGGHVLHPKLRPSPPAYWPPDLAAWPIPNRAVVAELRRLIDPRGEETSLVVPTTGMTAAYLGYSLFPDARLVLSGFSFLRQPDQENWSHRRGGTVPVARHHKIAKEGALMQSWVDSGRAEVLDHGP